MKGENVRKYNIFMEIGSAFGIFAPILMMVIRSINDLLSPGWDTLPQSQGFLILWSSQIFMYAIGFILVIYAQRRQRIPSLLIINLVIAIVGLGFLFILTSKIKEDITLYNTQVFLPGYLLCLLAIVWVINILREKFDNSYLWVALILTGFLTSIGVTEALGNYFYINEFNYIINKYGFWQYILKIYPWIIYLWTVVIWFYYSFILHHTDDIKVIKGIKIKHLLGIILVMFAIFALPTWVSVEIKNTDLMNRFVYQVDIEPTSVEGNSLLINLPFPKDKVNMKRTLQSTVIFDLKTKQIRKDVTISFINSRYGNMLRVRTDNLGKGISIKSSMYISNRTSGSSTLYLQPRIEKGKFNRKELLLSYSGVNSTAPIYYELIGDKVSFGLNYTLYYSLIDGGQEYFSQVMGGFVGKDELEKQQNWQINTVLDKF